MNQALDEYDYYGQVRGMEKDKKQAKREVWGSQGLVSNGVTIRVDFKVRRNLVKMSERSEGERKWAEPFLSLDPGEQEKQPAWNRVSG